MRQAILLTIYIILLWHDSCVFTDAERLCLVRIHNMHLIKTYKELIMRALLAISVLMSIALPAFADLNPLPEPETLSLLGIGVAGLLLARRSKK